MKISGKITYNGHSLNEFVPQRTSAYVNQQDWHVAEMTVRETLDFSARCQGVGCKYGIPWIFFILCVSVHVEVTCMLSLNVSNRYASGTFTKREDS